MGTSSFWNIISLIYFHSLIKWFHCRPVPPKSPALLTSCTTFKVLNNSLAEWLKKKKKKSLRGIIRAPWMWACSFQRGVGGRLTAIKNFEIRACGYNFFFPSPPPPKSVETGVFVCVCVPMPRHMQVCRRRIRARVSRVRECLVAAVSHHTYIGCLRGLQLGRPSLLKALRSQRHQLSMTSPFPAHQYELIVALLKACKG